MANSDEMWLRIGSPGPIGLGVITATPEQQTIVLQIVRVGLEADIPHEGTAFYHLTMPDALRLQAGLTAAIKQVEEFEIRDEE